MTHEEHVTQIKQVQNEIIANITDPTQKQRMIDVQNAVLKKIEEKYQEQTEQTQAPVATPKETRAVDRLGEIIQRLVFLQSSTCDFIQELVGQNASQNLASGFYFVMQDVIDGLTSCSNEL